MNHGKKAHFGRRCSPPARFLGRGLPFQSNPAQIDKLHARFSFY